MNWEGCERNQLWPNLRYYPGIHLKELRKTVSSLRIANLQAEILNQDLPNTKQEC
jgi:hypothetical protein